jgi:hypothetical protein
MNQNKSITLQFKITKLIQSEIDISQKSFNLEFENCQDQLIKLKKYSEYSEIEKEINKSMIEKANKIFHQNTKFESEMLFMHFINDATRTKIDSFLIINGYCSQIKQTEVEIQITCSLDNEKFEMQVIRMQSDSLNKYQIKEIALCSEDTNDTNQIVIIE